MNNNQFNLLAERLIKNPQQREAVRLHMFENISAYRAEKQIHGRVTATVSRDAERIQREFAFHMKLLTTV